MRLVADCSTGNVQQIPLTANDIAQQVLDKAAHDTSMEQRALREAKELQRQTYIDAIIAQYKSKTSVEPLTGGKAV